MAAYLRYLISNNTLFRIDVVGLNRMSDELQAIGWNINQIAYKVNKFGSLRIDQLRELQDDMEKIKSVFSDVFVSELRLYEYMTSYKKSGGRFRDIKAYEMKLGDGINRKILSGEMYKKKLELLEKWLLSDPWNLPEGFNEIIEDESKIHEVKDIDVDELLKKNWRDV